MRWRRDQSAGDANLPKPSGLIVQITDIKVRFEIIQLQKPDILHNMLTSPPSTSSTTKPVVLVTGGTGLVGKAIQHVIETSTDPRFGKKENEQWIFLNSKEGDLRCVW